MKKLIFSFFWIISFQCVCQKSIDSTQVDQLGYDPVELGNQTIETLKKMTVEEREWFKATFIHKRRGFKIPEKPITDLYQKNNKNN